MQLSRKLQAALVAGAAVLAVGGLSAALEVERQGTTTPTVLSSVSEMTLGDTATPTSPPTAAPVSVAVPADKADVPCGFTSGC
jgi:hypothetical protein